MKFIRVTYFALAALVFAASCSKEAAEPYVYDWADGKIYFKTSLSDVAYSRAQDMTLDRFDSFQVTCFNSADTYKDAAGFISPYFENATFIRKAESAAGTTYVSSPAEGPRYWPENDGLLRFFAFSPSLTDMAANNAALEGIGQSNYLNLINSTVGDGAAMSVGYRLGIIRINPDISGQFDFLTAQASGDRWKDFVGGVDLAFSHQLCQVELKAWGSGTDYNFDIAGVRIGNPVVEGEFIFADDSAQANEGWATTEDAVMDKVEYLYRNTETVASQDTSGVGDRLFRINSTEHNTQESAGSIMGKGGCAMVIPTVNAKWEGTDDPKTADTPYKTDRMYFSILMRVTDSSSGSVVYPYPGNKNGMTVISYAVDPSGNIVKRLYAGESEGSYFIDPDLENPYVPAEGGEEEILDFGWAAVPVDADWSAGKRYVYTLDYSDGIGLHDPADPEPGKPIKGKSPIEWGVSVAQWDFANEDENYTPDLIVPGIP